MILFFISICLAVFIRLFLLLLDCKYHVLNFLVDTVEVVVQGAFLHIWCLEGVEFWQRIVLVIF